MRISKTQSLATKRPFTKRVVTGFAAIAATAIIGSAGVAAAHPMGPHLNPHGKLVGSGYGGNGNHVSTGVDVNVKGDHNVINIVINYFFGS